MAAASPEVATDLEWWSQVVIPGALGVATLLVSVVSLLIARSAHSLADRISRREADTHERLEKIEIASAAFEWSRRRFAVDAEPHSDVIIFETARLVAQIDASALPLARDFARRLQDLSERVVAFIVEPDVDDAFHRDAYITAMAVVGANIELWVRGELPAREPARSFDEWVAAHRASR